MERENDSSKGFLWYFFTLLSFFLGAILFIIIKHSIKSKGTVLRNPDTKEAPFIKEGKSLNKVRAINGKMLSKRQKTIVKEIEEKGVLYPKDLQKLLPSVTTRTIRRDMTELVGLKLVEQKGSTKSTYYKYIGN